MSIKPLENQKAELSLRVNAANAALEYANAVTEREIALRLCIRDRCLATEAAFNTACAEVVDAKNALDGTVDALADAISTLSKVSGTTRLMGNAPNGEMMYAWEESDGSKWEERWVTVSGGGLVQACKTS